LPLFGACPAAFRKIDRFRGVVKYPFFKSIRSGLLFLVFISVLPALGIVIYSGLEREKHDIKDAEASAITTIQSLALEHEHAVENARQLLSTIARLPDVRNRSVAACNELFRALNKQNPQYTTILAADADGMVFANARPISPYNVKQRKYFQDVLRTKDFSVGEYMIGIASGRKVLPFAYPVLDSKKRVQAVVITGVDLERYAEMFKVKGLPEGSVFGLFDHKNIRMHCSHDWEKYAGRTDLPEMIKHMWAPPLEGTFTAPGVDGIKRLYAYKRFYLPDSATPYLFMRVGIPEKQALAPAQRTFFINLVLLCSALLMAIVLAWFVGRVIVVRRLDGLVNASQRLGRGDLTARTGVEYSKDELGQVMKSFDAMAGELEHKELERKQAEETLRKSEERYRSMFENAMEGIFQSTPEGRFISVNPAMARTCGFASAEEMIASIRDITTEHYVNPEDRDRYKRILEERGHVENIEHRIYRKDGRIIWVSVNSRAVRDAEGKIIYYEGTNQDITERKELEESLARSQAQYRNLVDNAPIGVFQTHFDGRIIFANQEYAKIMGYDYIAQLLSMNVISLYRDPEKRKRFLDAIRRTGVIKNYEIEIVSKGGETRHVLINGFIEEDYISGTAVDITDRKLAEQALSKSEREYRLIVDTAIEGIWTLDTNFVITYANRRISEMLGYDLSEIIGKPISTFIFPEDKADFELRKEHRRLGVKEIFERHFRRKDGSDCWTILSAAPISGEDGSFQGSFTMMTDITERKQMELALRESERRLADIIDFLPDATFAVDSNGTVIAWNRAIEAMTGVTAEDMLGKDEYEYSIPFYGERRPILIDLALHPDPEREKEYTAIHRMGDIIFGESYTPNLSPGNVHLSATASVLRDSSGEIIAAIECIRNNTDRKRLEAQLQQAQKMEAVGTLAGGIAHDFNNLLMAIQGNASLVLMNMRPGDLRYERLKAIEDQVVAGADLTKQLLGFARVGKYELKPIDLNDVMEKSSNMFGRTKKEILIHKKLDPNLWAVEADTSQMEQVLMNLFVNAWQAMPGGGHLYIETANVKVDESDERSSYMRHGRYVKVSVTDTGVGMDERTKGRIFEPFFTTKEMGRGTGLGLAMVYGIIKGHDGHINVYSEEGHGTTFNIYLPASEKEARKDERQEEKILRGKETILLVDDEQSITEVTKEILQALGYRVLTAGNGREAIAVYKDTGGVDLVILDMIMPEMGGGETFDRLKEINPNVRVILSSGYSMDGDAAGIMSRGCLGFIQKPATVAELSKTVRNVLGKKAENPG